jgi:L-lactate dehydrogenase complex protein LldG
MTDAREKMLAAIRVKIGHLPERHRDHVALRLQTHARHIIPERVNISSTELISLFQKQAESVGTRVFHIASAEIETQLKILFAERQIHKVKISDSDITRDINWKSLDVEAITGAATTEDTVAVTNCLCAVAETGTLVFAASKETPTSLNVLPEIHVVILHEDNIVASYEDAWDKIRLLPSVPRCVNLITGPSRTGDIEQKILMGAHGPRELWIFLIACHPAQL